MASPPPRASVGGGGGHSNLASRRQLDVVVKEFAEGDSKSTPQEDESKPKSFPVQVTLSLRDLMNESPPKQPSPPPPPPPTQPNPLPSQEQKERQHARDLHAKLKLDYMRAFRAQKAPCLRRLEQIQTPNSTLTVPAQITFPMAQDSARDPQLMKYDANWAHLEALWENVERRALYELDI